MSAQPAPAAPSGSEPGTSAWAGRLPPPAERGATVIPDRVVARIAAQAARAALLRRAAIPPALRESTGPSATAAARRGSVRLHVALDLPYPTDMPQVCGRIQHDVAARVVQLTGLNVAEVTLTVRRLVSVADAARGRVQ